MRTESEWKTQLCTEAKKMGWYARRIEDAFGVGFPDMVIRNGTGNAFIEAKLAPGNTFAPSPRQYIDLVDLHRPIELSFGIVLGIDERDKEVMFSFSEPTKKVDKTSPHTFHHINFHAGLLMFMTKILRREIG